ncbi:MAG: redoxin domain-containing protein, partial [Mariniphaga sp.]|nr:redoxin domain-containing protein [Mariniphaga sp.]
MNKLLLRIFTVFVLTLGFLSTYSAVIQGNEPDYAGKELVFTTYTDPITKNKKEIFKIIINADGLFKKEIDLSETIYCHSEFGIYKGLLILEPQSELLLKLPPLREKTVLESKNPYFEPILLWLRVESDKNEEVNKLVSNLEGRYIQLTNTYFNQLYYQKSEIHLDSVKIKLQDEFGGYQNPIIKNQLKFKLKILESDINKAKHQTVFEELNPVTFSFLNPAFIDLLNLVFNNKLSFEISSIHGSELREAVAKVDIKFIKSHFQEKFKLESSLADFVLLKLLHDGYYSNRFPKQSIISMLENPFFLNNPENNINTIAKTIKEKLLFLSPGSSAPVICLNDLMGNQQCSDNINEYGYIIFADSEMLVCREHLKYLLTVSSKFKDNLSLFVVIKNADIGEIKKFIDENKIPGTIVIDDESNFHAKKYKIKSYPSSFLLNSDHTVLLTPAKNPLDGFELEFASFLRSE